MQSTCGSINLDGFYESVVSEEKRQEEDLVLSEDKFLKDLLPDLPARGNYDDFIYWFQHSSFLRKFLIYLNLREKKLLSLNSLEYGEYLQKKYRDEQFSELRSRICVEGRGIPIWDEKVAARLIHADNFVEGVKHFTENYWPIIFYSLLAHDYIWHFIYPENRYGTKAWEIFTGLAKNQQTLLTYLTNFNWWGGFLFAAPVLCGLYSFISRYNFGHFSADDARYCGDKLWRHRDNFLNNNVYWLFPFYADRRALERAEAALLWIRGKNSRDMYTFIELFATLNDRVIGLGTHGLARLRSITALADIAATEKDLPLLAGSKFPSTDVAEPIAEAHKTLTHLASYPSSHTSLVDYLYAHYRLWSNGRSTNRYLDILNWLVAIGLTYPKLMLYMSMLQFSYKKLQFVKNWYECTYSTNGHYVYLDPSIGKYACTLCGDWSHMYSHDAFSGQTCLDGALRTPRTAYDFNKFVARVMPYEVTSLDLSHQQWREWNASDFDSALTKFSQGINGKITKSLDFSQSKFINRNPNITNSTVFSLAKFLTNVASQNLNVANCFANDAQTAVVLQGLAQGAKSTIVAENFNFTGNSMDVQSTEALGQLFRRIGSIDKLDLSHNNFSDVAIEPLSKALQICKVKQVDLSYNGFTQAGLKLLLQKLSFCIAKLNLAGNRLDAASLVELGKYLRISNLTSLSLENTGIDDAGLKVLSPFLGNNTLLEKLNVANNRFTANGLPSFCEILPQTKLYSLDVHGNKIGDKGIVMIGEAVQFTSICNVDFSNTECGDAGLSKSAASFLHTNVTSMRWANNAISAAGISFFAPVILNASMTEMDFSGNPLMDNGVKILSQVILSDKSALNKLVLRNVGCTQIGAEFLGNAFRYNRNIQFFDLSENYITDHGFEFLCPHFNNSNFTTVIMQNCGLTNVSAICISQVLSSSNMQYLDFGQNLIGRPGALAIAQNLISPIPHADELGNAHLGSDLCRAVNQSSAATQIKFLGLDGCNIDVQGMRGLCRTAYPGGLSVGNLTLMDNPIDQSQAETANCWVTSSSGK